MENIKDIKTKLATMAKDSVVATPHVEKPKNIWDSKIGGKAYWPLDNEYPTTKESNKPLFLLAQINLDDIPHLPNMPKTGLLQFFISQQYSYGFNFNETVENNIKNNYGYQVVYHEKILKDSILLNDDVVCPTGDENLPWSGEYALTFEVKPDFPSFENIDWVESIGDILDFSEELADDVYELQDKMVSKIGGYQDFTQTDPRVCDEKWTKDKWFNLFQLASDDNCDIMWGDCGVGNFSIREDDLKNKDFSNIWYNWDCG